MQGERFTEPNKHVCSICCDTELLRTAELQMKKQSYIACVCLHRVRACSLGSKYTSRKINKKKKEKLIEAANTATLPLSRYSTHLE